MKKELSKRNITLDLLKVLAAYMVVFIHVPFYGDIGIIIKSLARAAVPIFFLSSGFFCYGNTPEKVIKKIKNIVLILISTSVLYNVINIFIEFLSGGIEGILLYSETFLSLRAWLDLLIFNVPFSSSRLWFLFALIYVYGIQFFVLKKKTGDKTVFIVSIFMLMVNLILVEGKTVFNIDFPEHYTRNFLLTGYPLFAIGLMLKKHEDLIRNIRVSFSVSGILAGIALSILSLWGTGEKEIYLGSVVIAVFSFLSAVKFSFAEYPSSLIRLSECSLGIYILHKPVTTFLSKISEILNFNIDSGLFTNLLPILVCVFTTVSILLIKVAKKYYYRIHNK